MTSGVVERVSGPLVVATGLPEAKMFDVVRVGEQGLIGEVIEVHGEKLSIQVYEETSGLGPGDPVVSTGVPLSVELGPGIIEGMFDGIQRPLNIIESVAGSYITRGIEYPALDRKKKWDFKPLAKKGQKVTGGDFLGTVQETVTVEHRIMVPPEISGMITEIYEGEFTVVDTVAKIKTDSGEIIDIPMMHKWPVRMTRPYKEKLPPEEPMSTGQRVIDAFFPVAKGGAACIPGPFGSGKTVVQHQLAKWADAEIVVYIGCGERGNEMTDVLLEFPVIEDPKTGEPLMKRTVLIANTSNMPVAAREASIYTGITIAEYFRDMGYSVALMADSTSRWAEALREMSGRLEEMPGDEGYPAYLSRRIAEFYERAGRVITIGSEKRIGALTAVGAVSPPGGDLSEPVTQATLRVVKVFWALDASLAYARHFPAINWLTSYSLYSDAVEEFMNKNISKDWKELRAKAMRLLQEESSLQEIVRLVGIDALSVGDRLILEVARSIREDFLHQNAFHEVDTYTSLNKQYRMLKLVLMFYDEAKRAMEHGVVFSEIDNLPVRERIARVKYSDEKDVSVFDKAEQELKQQIEALMEGGSRMIKEYRTAREIVGPLMLVENVKGVKYNELVEIEISSGEIRRGQVLEIDEDKALVQLFEGSTGLNINDCKIRFLGKSIELGVSIDMLGRVFDGSGRPKDDGPRIIPEKRLDIEGNPINPTARDYPSEFIQTGISAIDGLNTLVRGQKLPIFSGAGLPHAQLATQIARQSKVLGTEGRFAVVFAAMGITFEEADFFISDFRRTGAIDRSVLFINLANDPAIERISTPRMALTCAEFLAFEKDMHVLVILTDMTNYCEALREVSAARKEVPGRRGYPGYLYTDLSTIYERAGRLRGKAGSITQLPILTMPEDDKTHPIPDLTGYITEGQIILSRELYRSGIMPPIDVLPSLSRLKDEGIGKGKTREDHADTMNQLFAAYARGKEAKELAVILGEAALSDTDKLFAQFADEFERRYVSQGENENRSIEETLELGWELLTIIPKVELKRIRDEYIEKYLPKKGEE